MAFEALDRIKRNAIFTAILMMALGVILLICPPSYGPTILLGFGFTLAVIAIVIMLNFFSAKKSLINYVKFTGAIIVLIAAICVLIYRENTLLIMALSFGVLLILDGIRSLIHSFTYARRARKKAWWVLTILAAILIIVGIGVFTTPLIANEYAVFISIGIALLFASMVSIFRLIWTWPIKEKDVEEVTTNE